MLEAAPNALLQVGRRAMLLFVGAIAIVAMAFAIITPSASAHTNFCHIAWVNPYGQGGDRCWGPSQYWLNWAAVRTYERAGCVSIADGSNNLVTSWVCGAAGSAPSFAAQTWIANYGGYHKGVVRNNNTSNGTSISGAHACVGDSC